MHLLTFFSSVCSPITTQLVEIDKVIAETKRVTVFGARCVTGRRSQMTVQTNHNGRGIA